MGRLTEKKKNKISVLARTKANVIAVAKEVFINFFANQFETVLRWAGKFLPVIISTLILFVYTALIKFTNGTYTFTGKEILTGIIIGIAIIFSALISARIRRNYIANKRNYYIVFGLTWRIKESELVGPYCPSCNKGIIEDDCQEESIEHALDDMFGVAKAFTYYCSRCKKSISIKMPMSEFRMEAFKAIGEKATPSNDPDQ